MILETQGQPFDLDLTLDAGQTFRWRKESDNGGGWWNGVVRRQLIRIRQGDGGRLEFECAPGPDDVVQEMLHRYFRLDDDIGAIYESISRDYRMAELVHRYHGLRLMRQEPWGVSDFLYLFGYEQRSAYQRVDGKPVAKVGRRAADWRLRPARFPGAGGFGRGRGGGIECANQGNPGAGIPG